MTKQTYDNYYREYYNKNKEYILRRTKAYRLKYGRKYYNDHKAEILARRKLRYAQKKLQEEANLKAGIIIVDNTNK